MTLYLIRHAESLSKDQAHVATDAERPLAPAGMAQTTGVAQALKAMGLASDRLLTSPLVRARQTAELLAKHLGAVDRVEICQALSPDHEPAAFVESLRQLHPALSRKGGVHVEGVVLAVGHQPYLGHLAASLIFGEPRDGIVLPPAGVCVIELAEFPRSVDAVMRGLWGP